MIEFYFLRRMQTCLGEVFAVDVIIRIRNLKMYWFEKECRVILFGILR